MPSAINVAASASVPSVTAVASGEDAPVARLLEAIVARLAPLPATTRAEVRCELNAHLVSLIAAHEELGATREEAVRAAMRQFGDSRQIARRYRRAWRSTDRGESVAYAVRRGLAIFAGAMGAMIAYILALSRFVLYPHHLTFAGSLYSDLLWYVVVGLPVLGGVWMGWNASRRTTFCAFLALAILTLISLPFAWLESAGTFDALPYLLRLAISTPAHLFALWLPIGGFAALFTCIAKQRHCRQFAGARRKRVS